MNLLIFNFDDVGDGTLVDTAVRTTAGAIAERVLGSFAGARYSGGVRIFRWLVNTSGAIIPKGTPVMTKAGEVNAYRVTPCTASIAQVRMQGIPQCDVPIDAGFYALVNGPGVFLGNGTVTVDVPQTTAAAGEGTNATVGTNESWGFATASNAAATTLGACFVKLP